MNALSLECIFTDSMIDFYDSYDFFIQSLDDTLSIEWVFIDSIEYAYNGRSLGPQVP